MESIPVEKTSQSKLEFGVIQAKDRMLNDIVKKKNWKLFIYVYFVVFTQPLFKYLKNFLFLSDTYVTFKILIKSIRLLVMYFSFTSINVKMCALIVKELHKIFQMTLLEYTNSASPPRVQFY